MEKFWAVILIFVVVAAAGLMYVNQVYNPQKETQMAMADMANQTLSAVKLEIGDGTYTFEAKGSEIEDKINDYVEDDEEVEIRINGTVYGIDIDAIEEHEGIEDDSNYTIEIEKDIDGKTQIKIDDKD
ncbi:MAG TPA: hypothetical protein VEG39_10330 [Clostridia bacterium]|nr:hypothetical protein [Clostridia bacterium]